MEVEFDQHFLENKEILEKEIKFAKVNKDDVVVEIGPGDCRLTKLILEKNPKKLLAIEMDERFEEGLMNLKNKFSNFVYIIGNGLDEVKEQKFDKLISNIPYSITEPLYQYLMQNEIGFAILLHGKNFYSKILSANSKWFYFVNSFYDVKLILEVDGKEFKPLAKVKSVLLQLELKEKSSLSKKDVFFQSLFKRETRNTKNALIFSLVEIGLTKKKAKEIVEELNLKPEILEMKLKNISNKSFIFIESNLSTFINN